MSNVYVISDLHFGHKNICNFRADLGFSNDELRGKVNVHGHTHNFLIHDKRYISVCCEQVNYTPVNLNDLLIGGG